MPNFCIGITFSGKYRKKYVDRICKKLLEIGFKKEDIFYDEWHEVLINGVNADETLEKIFRKCKFLVVILSPDYKEKNWTGNVEWPVIRKRINEGEGDRICLLSIGVVDLQEIGLDKSTTIPKRIDEITADQAAEFIKKKYDRWNDEHFKETDDLKIFLVVDWLIGRALLPTNPSENDVVIYKKGILITEEDIERIAKSLKAVSEIVRKENWVNIFEGKEITSAIEEYCVSNKEFFDDIERREIIKMFARRLASRIGKYIGDSHVEYKIENDGSINLRYV